MGIMRDNYQKMMNNDNYAEIIKKRLRFDSIFQVGLKYACEICDEMTESFKNGESFAECISKLTALDKERNRTLDYRIKLFNQQFILALGKEMFKDRFDLNAYNELMLESLTEAGIYPVAYTDMISAPLLETFQMPELASEVKNFEPILYGIQESLKTMKEYTEESSKFAAEGTKLDKEFAKLRREYEESKNKLEERFVESMKKMVEESGPSGNSNQKA